MLRVRRCSSFPFAAGVIDYAKMVCTARDIIRSAASENSPKTCLEQAGGTKSFRCIGKNFRVAF